jgi:hypothetical protein
MDAPGYSVDFRRAGTCSHGVLFFVREITNLWYSTWRMRIPCSSCVVSTPAVERAHAGEHTRACRVSR